jgi:nucleoside-diphosphate-sugar epimerase
MVRALESNATRVFHLAGPETVTLRQLIHRMGRALGKRPVIRVKPTGPNVNQAAEYRQTTRTLGYKPRMRLNDGLRLLAQQPGVKS